MSFLRSDGLTYSMTVVYEETDNGGYSLKLVITLTYEYTDITRVKEPLFSMRPLGNICLLSNHRAIEVSLSRNSSQTLNFHMNLTIRYECKNWSSIL